MKKCKYCKEEIHNKARICKCCGRHQIGFLNFLGDTAIILTFILFIISILQYTDSRRERIAAQIAYKTALEVKLKTDQLYQSVDSLDKELKSKIEFFNKTALLSARNSWIHANNPIMGINTKRQSVKEFEKNFNALIKLLIPDSTLRSEWLNKTVWLSKH